jgi:hypothetical protein
MSADLILVEQNSGQESEGEPATSNHRHLCRHTESAQDLHRIPGTYQMRGSTKHLEVN